MKYICGTFDHKEEFFWIRDISPTLTFWPNNNTSKIKKYMMIIKILFTINIFPFLSLVYEKKENFLRNNLFVADSCSFLHIVEYCSNWNISLHIWPTFYCFPSLFNMHQRCILQRRWLLDTDWNYVQRFSNSINIFMISSLHSPITHINPYF